MIQVLIDAKDKPIKYLNTLYIEKGIELNAKNRSILVPVTDNGIIVL